MQEKSNYVLFFSLISVFILLGLVPWGIKAIASPLQPNTLAETATAFAPTDSAFRTREAERLVSATSEITFSTPEDYGDFEFVVEDEEPEATEVAQGATPTPQPTANFVEAPTEVVGSTFVALDTFACPSTDEEYQTEVPLPAGTEFAILGWNVDPENNVYFLIEDNPQEPQVWIQDSIDVQLSTEEYRRRYPRATSCRILPISEEATAASTPVLPQASTATLLPPVETTIELTDEIATEEIMESVPELKDPAVHFSEEGLEITGEVDLDAPLGQTISGDVEMIGVFEVRENKLFADMTSIVVRGRDITDDEEGEAVENMVNNWLLGLMVRRDVQSYELEEGVLRINVLERQNSVLPTSPAPLETGTPVTQLEVTSGVIQLDNQSATSLAQSNLPGITSPQVYFTQDGVGINGTWGATLFGTDVGSDLAAFGNLTLQDGQLEFALEQASLAGIDIMDDPQSTQVNDIVGSWVNSLLGERPIESFSLDNGSLDINLLN